MGWTIRGAMMAPAIHRVVVNSDDAQVLSLAKEYGCDAIPRPEFLATNTASTIDVVRHTLEFYQGHGENFDHFILLQATSPLRSLVDIENAFQIFHTKDTVAVVSVCPCEHPPQWCGTLPPDLSMDHFLDPSVIGKRSQDLPQFYRMNGAIYLCQTSAFLLTNTLSPNPGTKALIMPNERSVDIDTAFDLQFAQVLAANSESV